MGNILYWVTGNQIAELTSKVETLEEYNRNLKARVNQLEIQVDSLSPSEAPERIRADNASGIDFKSIDKFVEKFMEKNPGDIGKIKPLQFFGLKQFEIDLMPPSVEKHLYSNIISLILGFFDNEIQINAANHRIHTIVSRLNK